jgi:hypothetical protein
MDKEAYTWAALYTDGSYIGEYDREEGRGFAEVDSVRVKQLRLGSCHSHLHTHYVEVPEGATPVFFRRRRINLVDGQAGPFTVAHCIGWKQGTTAVYLFVGDDGSTILTNNLQAV